MLSDCRTQSDFVACSMLSDCRTQSDFVFSSMLSDCRTQSDFVIQQRVSLSRLPLCLWQAIQILSCSVKTRHDKTTPGQAGHADHPRFDTDRDYSTTLTSRTKDNHSEPSAIRMLRTRRRLGRGQRQGVSTEDTVSCCITLCGNNKHD